MDNASFELLRLFRERGSLSAHDLSVLCKIDPWAIREPIQYLENKGFLRVVPAPPGDTPKTLDIQYRITPDGHRAFEIEQQARKHYKYNELRAWITLGIAVAAFILSVISLILQR